MKSVVWRKGRLKLQLDNVKVSYEYLLVTLGSINVLHAIFFEQKLGYVLLILNKRLEFSRFE